MQSEQPQRHQHDEERGFTAIVCHGPRCGHDHGQAAVREFRGPVRRHRHGVLISAGCMLGHLSCHAWATSSGRPCTGTLLIVQHCSPERTPIGPAWWIGPLTTEDDIATVRRWLDTRDLSITALPARLRFRTTLSGGATATDN